MHLGNLPSDILLEIIRMDLNSFDSIRLISPSWNKIALNYLLNRKSLPTINRFVLTISSYTYAYIFAFGLTMTLPEKYRQYFGVQNFSAIRDGVVNTGKGFRHGEIAKIRNLLNRIFARCSKIENLHIGSENLDHDGLGVDFILGAIGNLKIGKIELDKVEIFKDKNASAILRLSQIPSVHLLTIKYSIDYMFRFCAWYLDNSLFGTFISELMRKELTVVLTESTQEYHIPDQMAEKFEFFKGTLAKMNIIATVELKILPRNCRTHSNIILITLTQKRESLRRSARKVSKLFPKYGRI